MKMLLALFAFVVLSVSFMCCWSMRYDYKKRDVNLLKLTSKRGYIVPSFTFKSKAYREFVYAK